VKIFIDSSAIVKRYIDEPGSARIAEICKKNSEIAVCVICVTEVLSACNRLVRENKITAEQYKWIKNEFLLDIAEFYVIDLTNEVIGRSISCLEKGVMRSLDALHIAAALELKCGLFLTGDYRQRDLALIMGLNVEII
jgi:uncharacterized protein